MAGVAQNLSFILLGEDISASKAMTGAQKTAEKVTGAIGGAFSKLGGMIGGEFGEVLGQAGEGIEALGSKGAKLSTTMAVTGGVMVAAGLALQKLGAGEKQATDQLDQSIKSTGESADKYSKQIEEAVVHGENFAHSAIDTKEALTKLTDKTGSTEIALRKMGVVTDLAASKHISLSDSATLVGKILGGTGGKILAAYGITMDGVGTKTEQGTRALDQLSKKLDGQASASVNNFSSFLDIAKTKITDWAESVAGPAGEALTVLGTVVSIAGVALDVFASRQEAAAAASLAASAATEVETAAMVGLDVAMDANPIGLTVIALTALAAVVGGAVLLSSTQHLTAATVDYTEAVRADNGVIGENVKLLAAKSLQQEGAFTSAKKLGIASADLVKWSLGEADGSNKASEAIDKLQLSTAGMSGLINEATGGWTKASTAEKELQQNIDKTTGSVDVQKTSIAKAIDSYNLLAAATGVETIASKEQLEAQTRLAGGYGASVPVYLEAQKSTKKTADQLALTTTQMVLQNDAAGLLTNALTLMNGGSLTLLQAETGQAAALNALTNSFKDNGKEIDGGTEKVVANQQALQSKAQADQTAAEAIAKSTGSTIAGTAAYAESKVALENALKAQGDLTPAVQAYIDKIYAVPAAPLTKLDVDDANALSKLANWKAAVATLPKDALLNVVTSISSFGAKAPANPKKNAAGGVFTKPTQLGDNIFGESGPESFTVTPLNSGRINSDGNGSTTYQINVSAGISNPNDVAKAIVTAITNAARSGQIPKNALSTALTGR